MKWDYQLFEWINQIAIHPILDKILPFLRNGDNWIPLYVGLLLYSVIRFKLRSWIFIVFVFAAVGSTDAIGNYGFKKIFERPRPCHTESPVEARLLVNCGSGYSFTSNHAANHMCIALFVSASLFAAVGWIKILFIVWALAIGYAQIYVGVHYPADVAAGWTLGAIIAWIWLFIYRKVSEKVVAIYTPRET